MLASDKNSFYLFSSFYSFFIILIGRKLAQLWVNNILFFYWSSSSSATFNGAIKRFNQLKAFSSCFAGSLVKYTARSQQMNVYVSFDQHKSLRKHFYLGL